jgi:AcrR family transcriptional regulator
MPAVPATGKGRKTRDRIFEAARQVFARDGYVAARMTDIASAAGLSNGGLYRYFDSKPDVFAALIADIHEGFYEQSGHTATSFADDPYQALLEANRGYLSHYHEYRDVMLAFVEAASVEERFRTIWWEMRERHVNRFAKVVKSVHGITKVDGVNVAVATEAMVCMVEQCAYVWFAHEDRSPRRVSVKSAAAIVTHSWYQTFFAERS